MSNAGSVLNNAIDLGNFANIRLSYSFDTASFVFTPVNATTVDLAFQPFGLRFIPDPLVSNPQPILDYFAGLPSFSGRAVYQFANLGYVNDGLSLRYSGFVNFSDPSVPSVNATTLQVTGTLQLPNFNNSDPNDLPTYITNNLESAAFNNATLTALESAVFRDQLALVTFRSTNFVASVPFEFSPALGLGLLGTVWAFKKLRVKRK